MSDGTSALPYLTLNPTRIHVPSPVQHTLLQLGRLYVSIVDAPATAVPLETRYSQRAGVRSLEIHSRENLGSDLCETVYPTQSCIVLTLVLIVHPCVFDLRV